jgi:ribosomal protein S28E/S33
MYDMLGVSEAHQRELVLLSIMLEQPSFVPLDMLIGELKNPCVLAEVRRAKGAGSGPIHIAGNHTVVSPGNAYAANEGWSIAGRECYEGRMLTSDHGCLHRGAKASTPKFNIQVGIPEWTEWWSSCQVRMRWEALEQGSENEKESTVCVRIAQARTEGTVTNRNVMTRTVEADILALVNLIREQCFQHVENFVPGDIRYQRFEDQEGLGRGMITINRRKVNLFEVDVAIGCLLGFYLGNGIQASSGRAYK